MNLYKGYLVRSEKHIEIYADKMDLNRSQHCIVFSENGAIHSSILAVYPARELIIDEIVYDCHNPAEDNCVL